MSTNNASIEPYLFFSGRCEEALQYYCNALGAEIEMMVRFKDSPEPPQPGTLAPGFENKIMHATLRVGKSRVMASDGCTDEQPKFEGFSLSFACETEAEAERAFNALAAGGQVRMPLTKTFWSPKFGMLEDKFGIGWMINVVPKS